jgi:hypothetical protein
MTLAQQLYLNRLWFELIEVQSKIAFYDNKGWGPRKLYQRIEEIEAEIQTLTATTYTPRDSKGRFVKR